MTSTPPESAARDGERSTPRPAGPEAASLPASDEVDRFLAAALAEDAGTGDVTSLGAVPEGARARARLIAKEAGVLSGLPFFVRTFELCDPQVEVELAHADGEAVEAGEQIAVLVGDARALLLAERTALNILQRLSGIATRTRGLVRLAVPPPTGGPAGGRVRLLDTRKTTPGLRVFEKYAVRCGGGDNHRFGLFDEVLVKENHIDLAGRPIPEVLADLRKLVGPDMRMTCEARTAAEARQAVAGGADVVMLDNMSPADMGRLVPELRELATGRDRALEIEASGGISEETLPAVAASGVDRISVGALTHSVFALDLSLYLEAMP